MKSNFQYCAYCGKRQPMDELRIEQESGFLMCRDDTACYNRVNGENAAYVLALETRLASIEEERAALIIKIGDERKKRGMPDPVEERNKLALAQLEAE